MQQEILKDARILIVDDEEANVSLLERLLKRAGYTNLKGITDSRHTVPLCIQFVPDLVLLDLNMPHMDGFAVMEEVKSLITDGTYLPILVLTADTTSEAKQRALSMGAKDFLSKPFDLSEVLLRVKNLLETRLQNLAIRRLNESLEARVAERTAQVEATVAELRESEERFRSLVRSASDMITVVDTDGTIQYDSPAVETVLGYRPEERVGTNALSWFRPEDMEWASSTFTKVLDKLGLHAPTEFPVPHKDGSQRYLETIFNNLLDDPSVRGIVVNSRDITERKTLEDQLVHQAFHDPLTDLPNRALFLDRLKHALARASRRDIFVAVLFIDLDNFKVVNDSLGHESGDRLLVSVGKRLRQCLRAEDTVARFGGDEFTILLEDIADESYALSLSERVMGELRAPFVLQGHEVHTTASIGIVLGTSEEDHPEDLLRQADIAMYKAKNSGKARYEMLDSGVHAQALERLGLESDLRRALERDELRVYYQPKVLLETGQIVGTEALVRWEHPERGLVSPALFISIAEETGLILPLGRWVLRKACRQTREWQERYPSELPLTVCVNLSARQFRDPELVKEVVDALEEVGLDAGSLVLEITESVVMEDAPSTTATMRELKALGVRLAIDDFGTGYSSLSYLKRFPVDYLKIDRSFVDGLGEDTDDNELVSGTIGLAHALRLKVIAEGVETDEQLVRLREMGCEFAQGYYFSRPLPSEATDALLADKSSSWQVL